MYSVTKPLTIRQIVRMASDELDSNQLALLAPITITEQLTLLFDLCDFVRDLAFSVERQENPGASDFEIGGRLLQGH